VRADTLRPERGALSYAESYSDQLWVRNLDHAALKRWVYPYGGLGPPQFERPAFNEDRDPGPPPADIFGPAPKKPTPTPMCPPQNPAARASRRSARSR